MTCLEYTKPLIVVDPGHTAGVVLVVPVPQWSTTPLPDGVEKYRISRYGLLRPTTTPAVRDLFNDLIVSAGATPVLYAEDQYIDPQGKGEKRLRGASLKALLKARLAWEIWAELVGGVAIHLVMPSTWQAEMLGLRGGPPVKRSARKKMAQDRVRAAFGCEATQDESDAILMACWAVGHQGKLMGRPCKLLTDGVPQKGERWR